MALPKINQSPKYKIEVPSTGQTLTYRPYLVKEEKILMLAMESKDQGQVLSAVTDTIASCVYEELDVNKLTTFDVEYLFIKIRAKSVGEHAAVSTKCPGCGESVEFSVNIDEIKMQSADASNNHKKIKLSDEVTLNMKWPTYDVVSRLVAGDKTVTDITFDMIIQCMDTIATDEEMIKVAEEPRQEVVDFLESLTREQFTQIREFIDNMPKLSHSQHLKCHACSHEFDINLEGMNDFF